MRRRGGGEEVQEAPGLLAPDTTKTLYKQSIQVARNVECGMVK